MTLLADAPSPDALAPYRGRHGCRDEPRPADAVRASVQLERAMDSLPHTRGTAETALRAWRVPQRTRVHALHVLADLAINAVEHGQPEPGDCDGLLIALSIADGYLRVEVGDFSNRLPKTPRPGGGLERVQKMAGRWGVQPAEHRPGKTVWAELVLRASL